MEAELMEEDEEQATALLGNEGDSEEITLSSESYVEPTYEYIKYCDDFEIPEVHPEPKTRMPSTWQEYQFLQEQVAAFTQAPNIDEEQRVRARKHADELQEL